MHKNRAQSASDSFSQPLSLASKPMAITLPYVLLLLDFWPPGRIQGWSAPSVQIPVVQGPYIFLLLGKDAMFPLCVTSAIVTIAAQRKGVAD
jgi:hypothetical protein